MPSLRLTALALLAACAPPEVVLGNGDTGEPTPPVEADPSIRIVHPAQDSCFNLDALGNLSIVVAVDVDNFEVVVPGELVDGQGHWHVQLEPVDTSYSAVTNAAQFYLMEREAVAPGPVSITATMVDSGHLDLGGPGTVGIVEFELKDAADPCP